MKSEIFNKLVNQMRLYYGFTSGQIHITSTYRGYHLQAFLLFSANDEFEIIECGFMGKDWVDIELTDEQKGKLSEAMYKMYDREEELQKENREHEAHMWATQICM